VSDHNFNSNLESIRNQAEKLNSEFIRHIKLFFRHQENIEKESVTSAYKIPKMEVLGGTLIISSYFPGSYTFAFRSHFMFYDT
jgi:hypothetical protein